MEVLRYVRIIAGGKRPPIVDFYAWLSAGMAFLGDVRIMDVCVVATEAVVPHDLPPYSIAVGVPAKITGFRR